MHVDGGTGRGPEVMWDEWGVPHIYAEDDDAACFGMGWAQARAHAGLVLELYAVARGRAAEYWGPEFLASDRLAWTLGLPDIGTELWQQQSAPTRERVAAFCDGFNAWCEANASSGAARRQALPVVPSDIYQHYARNLFHYAQISSDGETQVFPTEQFPPPGSNAWAVGAARSSSLSALLLTNPHLPWTGRFVFFESHAVSPGRDFYGVCSVGLPWANIGFNPLVGWTHTVNPIDLFDAYRLECVDGGYILDGEPHTFETDSATLRVRNRESMTLETVELRRSVHGPVVVGTDGTTAAIRIAGLTVDPSGDGLEGWWRMSLARDIDELVRCLHTWQLPLFCVVAASAEGRVAAVYAGRPAVRPHGTYETWTGWLPGNRSDWLWDRTHPQSALPAVVDPVSGFVQNTNDPPWTFTWPPLDVSAYPATVAPSARFPGFRALSATQPFVENAAVGLDDLVRLAFSTKARTAEHVLDDLIRAIPEGSSPELAEAKRVLSGWDRHCATSSRGAVLFLAWVAEVAPRLLDRSLYATPWSVNSPFDTPGGLADPAECVRALERAARQLTKAGLALDLTIGEGWRVRVRGHEAPADGGPGILGVLKSLTVAPVAGDRPTAVFGLTYISAVEFTSPPRAFGLLVYDNWTEPGVPQPGRQLLLSAQNELRPLHLRREDVQEHLHEREVCPGRARRP